MGYLNYLKKIGSYPLSGLALVTIAVSAALAFILVLFLDVVTLPFGGYADQRFALVVLSGLLVIVPVTPFLAEPQVAYQRVLWACLPVVILCLTFVALTLPFYQRNYVWVEPGMYAFYFLAFVISGCFLVWSGNAEGYVRLLIVVAAAACLLYGLMSINVYLFAIFDGVTKLDNFLPWGFVNIRYWSHIATWCLPLLSLAVIVGPLKEFRLWRYAVLLGGGLWWWVLFLSTGRGSMLGIAFGVVLAALLLGRQTLPWLKVFVMHLGAGIVLWMLLSVLIPTLISDGELQVRTIHAGGAGRLPLFFEAWHMSLQNVPFGMGPQSWLTHDILTEGYSASTKFGHPHNMYLMWAAEYGWLLIAALGLMAAQAITYIWRKRREVLSQPDSEQALLLAGFVASVSAALFHAGVSAVFMAPGSMLVGLFVLIGFWSLIVPGFDDPKATHPARPAARKRAIIAFVIAGLGITLWAGWMREVVTYYQDMVQDEDQYYKNEGGGIQPRFWFHGNFPRR